MIHIYTKDQKYIFLRLFFGLTEQSTKGNTKVDKAKDETKD
jgi:hypothetical protein